MSSFHRRLQILIDDDRFARLEAAARERGVPVAVLVREAIDQTFPARGLPRRTAADRFLAREPLDLGTWAEAKRDIEDSLGRGLAG